MANCGGLAYGRCRPDEDITIQVAKASLEIDNPGI
jgi:hypothetical protein